MGWSMFSNLLSLHFKTLNIYDHPIYNLVNRYLKSSELILYLSTLKP